VPGGGTTFSANPTTISRGSNTFLIEDPQNRYAPTSSFQSMQVDGVSYEWYLDSTNNVLRCYRQVQ